MKIIIDLDGVICSEEKTFERSLSKPLPNASNIINQLYDNGHDIIIYTGRSWSEEKMTKNWLSINNIKYHSLIMGKIIGDVWIDDRAIHFENWDKISCLLNDNIKNDYGLYILRLETKEFVECLSSKALQKPILEIGPNNITSNIFQRMPDTYFDSKKLFKESDYISLDIDKNTGCTVCGSVTDMYKTLFEENSIGTIICNSVFEHVPDVWKIPQQFHKVLKNNGKVYCLSPWAIRLHGPRPDCWRISDDGFNALFGEYFDLRIDKIGDDKLNPIAFMVEMTKK